MANKEVKSTHLVTTFKMKEFHTDEDHLLILLPVEVTVGEIGRTKKFTDSSDGQEYLPVLDAYKRKKSFGYMREVEIAEIMSKGYETLVNFYNHDAKKIANGTNLLQAFKEEYVEEMKYLVFFYDLNELVPIVTAIDHQTFFEEYGYSVNYKTGTISTSEPVIEIDDIFDELEHEAEQLNKEQEKINDEQEKSNVKEDKKSDINGQKVKITRLGLIDYIKSYIISQDEQVEEIASAVYRPLVLKSSEIKRNIMIYGPTGTGKTEIVKLIANKLGFPFYKANVASFSSTGYVGDSVEDIYAGLYLAANRDKERLEAGAIVMLDEVDKLLLGESGNDVKKQVYNELLTTLDPGGVVNFSLGNMGQKIAYDKKNLIVVSTGSFSSLDRKKIADANSRIGFGTPDKQQVGQVAFKYTNEDFYKAGVPLEFLARQDIKIGLNALTEDDLYKILTTALSSPYRVYERTLSSQNIKLTVPESGLRAMASKAYKMQCGARSLRSVFDFAVVPEIDRIIDKLDDGTNPENSEAIVSEEQIVKRLEHYHG